MKTWPLKDRNLIYNVSLSRSCCTVTFPHSSSFVCHVSLTTEDNSGEGLEDNSIKKI